MDYPIDRPLGVLEQFSPDELRQLEEYLQLLERFFGWDLLRPMNP
mgnify:CR=1 FL=1